MAPPSQVNDPPKSGQPITQNGDSAVPQEGDWDEEHLEKALETLDELYIQCRNLRTTIPRLLAPLTTKQPSPGQMFSEFNASSKTANEEVQRFRKSMSDKETRQILDHATNSRAGNAEGIKPWMITQHPEWYDSKSS